MTTVTAADGTALAVQSWGNAQARLVVLVHGLGLSVRAWGSVPERLAEQHHVVAYDLRGHGDSASARDYSLAAHADDLTRVLRETAGGRRATVVGNSLGGGIILAANARSQDLPLAGVVFAGSGGSGVTVPGLPAHGAPEWAQTAVQAGWLQALRATALAARRIRSVGPVADWFVRRAAFTPDTPTGPIARVREDFMSTRRRALARTTLASVSHDGIRFAPQLHVPTLVLHGDRDPEVKPAEVRQLLEALPDAELVTCRGAGHMLPLTHTDLVVEQVSRWVERTVPASRG